MSMTRRLDRSIEDARRATVSVGSRHRGAGNTRLPRRWAPIVRLCALVMALGAITVAATPAQAVTFVNSASHHIAMIPTNLSGDVPTDQYNNMPISSFVFGFPAESFDQFSFTNVPLGAVTGATLSHYDTAVLNQVQTSSLTSGARTALAQFVASGGKLIIHDSDETTANDYSWLFPGSPYTTNEGAVMHPLGQRGGTSTIESNSSLISANPADPAYVDLTDLHLFTDAIPDTNLLVSTDPRWFVLAKGTDAVHNPGAQLAYASNNNGLIVYNGYDTSFIKQLASDPFRTQCTVTSPCYVPGGGGATYPTGSTISKDWLAQMWYHELLQAWGTPPGTGGGAGLPHSKPLAEVGTPLAARLAGLPSNRLCVAGRRLALALKKLAHLHGRKVVRVEVFVNGKFVRRESGHFRNVTLKHLPRHGTYTVEVIATTKRGFHLIAKRRYHGC